MNRFRCSLSEKGLPRFFSVTGFSVFAALSTAAFLGETVSIAAAVLTAGIAILVMGIRRKVELVPVILLSVSLAFSLYAWAYHIQAEPFEVLDQTKARIHATVLEGPEEENHKYYYKLKVTRVEEVPQLGNFTVRFSTNQALFCQPGDEVECLAGFYTFEEGGLYSAKNARLAKGTVMGAYLAEYGGTFVIPAETKSLLAILWEVRRSLRRCVEGLFPQEEASLVRAMLLGEKDGLSADVESDFRDIGASHLLVISGLHLSALAAFFSLFLSLFRLGRRVKNLLTAAAVLLFLILIGFPFSAVRSGIMLLLFLFADCLGREADSLNSLGFALLLIGVLNPFSGGDVGLALSALSTLGILKLQSGISRVINRPFQNRRYLRRAAAPLTASLSVSLACVLATLPVQLLVFDGFSLLSPLSSLLLVLPGTLLLYTAVPAVVLSLVPWLTPAAAPFRLCAGLLAQLLLRGADGLGRLPVPFAAVSQWGAVVFLCFLGAALALCRLGGRRRTVCVSAAGMCVLVLCLACGLENRALQSGTTLAVADEGEASCVVLLQDGKAAVLSLDGYNTGAAASILKRANVREITSLRLSADSWEAAEAARRLLRKFSVKQVIRQEALYLGKELAGLMEGIPQTVFSEELSYEAMEGLEVRLTEEGALLTFSAEGVDTAVETGKTERGTCSLLLTNQVESSVNSSFTVLQTDDIIEETESGRARFCISAGESRIIWLRLKDGTAAIRRED